VKERVYKWDNAKALLIFFVVYGHFANEYARPADGDVIMKGISIFIYLFHMPAFIFLSGLFVKKYDKDHPFPWDRVLFFAMLGYLLKIIIFFIKTGFGKKPVFLWLSDTGMPWYMFAMAAFMVLVYAFQDADPGWVLPVSIGIACLAGYCDNIGIFLNLSRILVFFPYYYMGYLTDPKKLETFLNKKEARIGGALIIIIAIAVIVLNTKTVYGSIRMFTGRNSYSGIQLPSYKAGGLCRLVSYLVSIIMGLAFFSLIPDKKLPVITGLGQKTLQIYFWHRLFLYVLVYSGFNAWLVASFPNRWRLLYMGIATGVTLICSLPVFYIPFPGTSKRRIKA